jgi:hypothetical protein
VKSTIDTYQTNSKLTIQSSAAGGSGGSIARTPDQIDAAIGALPETARTATSPFRIVVQPYEILENFPNVSFIGNLSVLDSMTRLFYQTTNLQRQVENILSAPDNFIFEGSATIQNTRVAFDTIDNARVALAQEIARCSPQPKTCVHPINVPSQDYEFRVKLPVQKGSFPYDTQYRDILAKRGELSVNIGKAQRREFDPTGAVSREFQNQYMLVFFEKEDALARAEQERLTPLRQNALITERVRFWISEPARVRCGERVAEPCLSQQQVGHYEAQMRNGV